MAFSPSQQTASTRAAATPGISSRRSKEFVLPVSARQLAHVDRRRQLALADALEIFGVLPHLVA